MRCSVCDRALSDKEIILNDVLGKFEPCSKCLDESLEAAFGGDFDDDEEFEVYDEDEYYNYIHDPEPEEEDE